MEVPYPLDLFDCKVILDWLEHSTQVFDLISKAFGYPVVALRSLSFALSVYSIAGVAYHS